MILSGTSNRAYITIVSLASDNDLGGLTSTDTIRFYLKYVVHDGTNPQTTHEIVILTANLANYQRYSIDDQQGPVHCFNLMYRYNLNQIQDYQNIKLMYIGVAQSVGQTHGNEVNVVVGFDDPPH